MKTDELIIYRHLTAYPLLNDLALCTEIADDIMQADAKLTAGLSGCVYDLIAFANAHGFSGNLWRLYLTERIVNDENAYALSCERNRAATGSVREAALSDFERIKTWFEFDWAALSDRLQMPQLKYLASYEADDTRSAIYSRAMRDAIAALEEALSGAKDAARMLDLVTEFYVTYGAGALGLHKAFRVKKTQEGVEIEPIRNIRHVRLSDLVGYEDAKALLKANTEAFLEHRPANNCLLYGDAGTGKSTSIKAIANTYFDKGLRVIELYKHQAESLHDVIDQIMNRNYRFIVYMDDLSFEDFETEYKYLKAVIEGGLEKKPENVLIYATSNRRHIIRESFKDKPALLDDDIHRGETVQEKLSLFHRFGVAIYYGAPGKDAYEEIVRVLAKNAGITDLDDETLILEATRWEMTHGGRSGRTATQFVDDLAGKRR